MFKNMIKNFLDFFVKHEKLIFKIVMIAFMVLTAIGIAHHEPWRDEAQAWLIAQDLSPIEILNHMKYEGHLILWYLVMMPFAKLHIPYPLPMLIANMVFAWGAVYVLWKKAPFHPLVKILITFSLPIAYQYAVVARCYSMGIFFLFLLAAYFKEKVNRPYLYSLLLILCANTSVMAIVGAGAFGILFLYDYLKEKKDFFKTKEFYITMGILAIGAGLVFYQLLFAKEGTAAYQSFVKNFFLILSLGFFKTYADRSSDIYACMYFLLCVITFFKDKRVLFFFLCTTLGLYEIFSNFYGGSTYHHMFFFEYFLISLWLYQSLNNHKTFYYKMLYFLFAMVLIYQCWFTVMEYNYDIKYAYSSGYQMAQKIADNPTLRNANLITCDGVTHVVVPYLRNNNILVYSCFDGKKATYFDQSSKKPYYIDYSNLNKKNIDKFMNKDTYLIFSMQKTPEASDVKDYSIEMQACVEKSFMDTTFICIAKILPKKTNTILPNGNN